MTNKNKLNYIIALINTMPEKGGYKIKECKRNRVKHYTDNIDKLTNIEFSKLENYSFTDEVLRHSEQLEKKTYVSIVTDKVQKLEVHKYAPELNQLHFNNATTFKTPHTNTINEAIIFFIDNHSLKQLKHL